LSYLGKGLPLRMETEIAKMVVVDDIRSVLDMITTKIPWEEYGVNVVGRARDGEEGLSLIKKERPDIVLTDIRMPKLDGLSMTENIIEILPKCKVVILSGYADFEYARQAIQLGAIDFIKKPFTVQEVINVTLKAKEEWLEDKRTQASIDQLEKQVKQSMPMLRQEHLNLLMHYQVDRNKSWERWDFLGLDLRPDHLSVMIVEIDDFHKRYANHSVHDIELIRFALQNILEETVRTYTPCTLFRETVQRFVILLNCSDAQAALSIAEKCCVNIEKHTKFTVSIGVGSIVIDICGIPESYQQAVTAISYHFYTGGNAAFHASALPVQNTVQSLFSIKMEESFIYSLRSGNEELALEILNSLVQEITSSNPLPPPEYVSNIFALWTSVIYRTLLEIVPAEKLRSLEERTQQLRTRSNTLSLQEMHDELKLLVSDGCQLTALDRQNESQKIIQQALQYIISHIGEELTIDRCARVVNLSGGYFANLFKKEMGKTFNQYVTHERISLAKSMLIAGEPVQNIATELGYEHRRYFSDVFKKHTGMTPSEFKEYYLGAVNS
jgi:two-component system response regulator YesN